MKTFKVTAFTLGILAVIYAALSFFYFPGVADQKIRAALTQAGFDVTLLPKPQAGLGVILYQNVNLDKDGFSQVVALRAAYDPVSLMTSGVFNDLEIGGLSLVGEWDGETWGAISFAGWKPSAAPPLGIFRHINIVNSAIGLQSQHAGGFSFTYDLDAWRRAGDKTEFQVHVKTEEPTITIDGGAHGNIDDLNQNFAVSADVDLQDGKIEAPDGKLKSSRMNGSGNLSAATQGAILKFSGDVRAGALSLYGLPWQDATIHADLSAGDLKISVQAKAAGAEGVNLDMTAENGAADGKITAVNAPLLVDYFKGVPAFEALASDIGSFRKAGGGVITFHADAITKILSYEIKIDGETSAKSGQITLP